jgi:hypothetical protein
VRIAILTTFEALLGEAKFYTFEGRSIMTEPASDEIIVVGQRRSTLFDSEPFMRFSSNLLAKDFSLIDLNLAQGGANPFVKPIILPSLQGPKIIFHIQAMGVDVIIPKLEWSLMTPLQQKSLLNLLENLDQAPATSSAIAYYASQGVTNINIRYGTEAWRHDGTPDNWTVDVYGRNPMAQVSYRSEPNDPTRFDLVPGTSMTISINSLATMIQGGEMFTKVIMHELFHAYIPDAGVSGPGNWTDHTSIEINVISDYQSLFGTKSPLDIPDSILGGINYLGSWGADAITGSTSDDVLAGGGGSDFIDGGGGNDLIFGGPGMDTLTVGSGRSELVGGLDADNFIVQAYDAVVAVRDHGGVELLSLPGYSSAISVRRDGNDLHINSLDGYTAVVIGHYSAGGRVEKFEFADGFFSASYMDYLANGGTPGGPGYGMPVVLDLDGDGASFISAADSKARFDVDGDGIKDRVGWIDAGDAFLALDRNGNGRIDDFSELSFVEELRGAATDLEGLLAFDVDRDGFLTAADPMYAKLLVWRDLNGDGNSQKGELLSLADAGISSIGLEIFGITQLDTAVSESQVLGWTTGTRSDGTQFQVFDAALYYVSKVGPGIDLKGLPHGLTVDHSFLL